MVSCIEENERIKYNDYDEGADKVYDFYFTHDGLV